MVPDVILHTAVSLDGRIANFPANLELYYGLAARWNPDAIIFGSETVLAAVRDNPALEVPAEHEEMFRPPEGSPDTRPLLVIADSRGRVRCWDAIRRWPYMRDVMALCSESTPREYLDYLAERHIGVVISGRDRIDMKAGLETLHLKYGIKTIRSDSGGTLNSVLLATGLVGEVSVPIHPLLAGGEPSPTLFDPVRAGLRGLQVPLKLQSHEVLGNGLIWARYTPR